MTDKSLSGALDAYTLGSDYAATAFTIRQILAQHNHATLVKIVSCTTDGAVVPTGFVDVQPLVEMLDGSGKTQAHGVVHRLKYLRMQGGSNGIILDPASGDIGVAVFSDRDTSNVISTGSSSPPGSYRQNDFADGIYLGCVLNAAPTQFIQFNAGGITLASPQKITLNAPVIEINGQMVQAGGTVSMDGPATVQNDLIAAGISLQNHVHGGVKGGPDTTGGPQG